MKRLLLLLLLLLLPLGAMGESLSDSVNQVVDSLDAAALVDALSPDDPFAATGGFRETLRKLARGEITLGFDELLGQVWGRFLSALSGSVWRLTRLMSPALLLGLFRHLTGKHGDAGKAACYLMVCVFLTQDLSDHAALCTQTVAKMSSTMHGLMPLLLTMMAAVGGSAGSALMQPMVVAAADAMTLLIEQVSLPLAVISAVLTMLCHLGDGIRIDRLASLAHQAATWTLGLSFTVYIGVIMTRGMTASAVDGVTIRTAKYALDNFVPVVGGLFADTVDTLVGSSMLVQGALGISGLMLLLSVLMTPLCQTAATVFMYRLAAALMQPVSDGEIGKCIHDFSKVLMLLFIIQLCVAAMFLMLIAQLIAVSGMTMMLR